MAFVFLFPVIQMPMIVGIDGTEPALEAIRQGTMQGTVLNDA